MRLESESWKAGNGVFLAYFCVGTKIASGDSDMKALTWKPILSNLTEANGELRKLHWRLHYLVFRELPEDCPKHADASFFKGNGLRLLQDGHRIFVVSYRRSDAQFDCSDSEQVVNV